MNRIALFADINDLYYSLRESYGQAARLCYPRYIQYLDDVGEVAGRYAYVVRCKKDSLTPTLVNLDFTIRYSKPRRFINHRNNYKGQKVEHCVPMTLDICNNINNYDTFILGSSNADLLPVIRHLISQEKKVIIYSSGIPQSFNEAQTCLEIPRSLLLKGN